MVRNGHFIVRLKEAIINQSQQQQQPLEYALYSLYPRPGSSLLSSVTQNNILKDEICSCY
jgi:hypothetical protein